jgi:hypothetical protein
VAGAIIVAFGGSGVGSTSGPRTFEDVAAGRGGPEPDPDQTAAGSAGRTPNRWTKTWANFYTYTAAFELFLGLLFLFAAVKVGDGWAPYLPAAGMFLIAALLVRAGLHAAAADRLHDQGLKGTATIESVRQTGIWMNNNPVVVLGLLISLDGYPP